MNKPSRSGAFFALFLMAMATPVAAQTDLQAIINHGIAPADAQALLDGDRLSALTKDADSIKYAPKASAVAQKIWTDTKSIGPKTCVEALYYLKGVTGASSLAVYNSLLQVSKLSGTLYYSRSEKRVKTLIYRVYAIDNVKSNREIADPVATTLAPEMTFDILQNDETFGKSPYKVTAYSDKTTGEVGYVITNYKTLKDFIPVANPEGMRVALVAIPMTNGTLLYGLAVNTKSAPGFLQDKMNQSLLNRLDAFRTRFAMNYPIKVPVIPIAAPKETDGK